MKRSGVPSRESTTIPCSIPLARSAPARSMDRVSTCQIETGSISPTCPRHSRYPRRTASSATCLPSSSLARRWRFAIGSARCRGRGGGSVELQREELCSRSAEKRKERWWGERHNSRALNSRDRGRVRHVPRRRARTRVHLVFRVQYASAIVYTTGERIQIPGRVL